MLDLIDHLPQYAQAIQSMRDIIITNIILLGQIPAPTFQEKERVDFFMERMAEFQVDECTTDGFRNPIGIIRGTSRTTPPIFVVAHMDTPFSKEVDHHFTVKQDTISGAGLLDNSVGAGVLLSLPELFRKLDIQPVSDIVLAGVIQSIGRGNLRGIRHLLKTWSTPIRGAVCIESGELGRLDFSTDSMIRCEIICSTAPVNKPALRHAPNAILVLNQVINRILELWLPLKQRAEVAFGNIRGGLKHGQIAQDAVLGIELRSDSDNTVRNLYTSIYDSIRRIAPDNKVTLKMVTISNVRAARLNEDHPLVKSAAAIMKKLDLKPVSEPSESELSIFLSHRIPTLTLGVSHGEGYQQTDASVQIAPMFDGIAQIIGTIMAIDSGVCDEPAVD